MHIDSYGIEFQHNGATVVYIWPWKRTTKKGKYLSMSFNHTYETLKAIDKDWKAYFIAMRKGN